MTLLNKTHEAQGKFQSQKTRVTQVVGRRAVRSGKIDATEYRLIIPTIIMLKQAPFLPNYIEEMDLKDLENAGGRVCFDLMRSITSNLILVVYASLLAIFGADASAQSQSGSAVDFARYAMKLPENTLIRIQPKVTISRANNVLSGSGANEGAGSYVSGKNSLGAGPGEYSWKLDITTTIFWVGEQATVNNPVSNDKSAWDIGWFSNYGGYDSPNSDDRQNFIPTNFIPRQNPFYVALPYNDVDDHHTKPEAAQVIPWFKSCFVQDGQSVCKGRWVAIRHGNKVCYAQWEDVGPYQTDHWQYVFGNERPRPNPNKDAGLDVSPAVRDYLALDSIDVCDWKFVDFFRVPRGPWAIYGDNNTFSRLRRPKSTSVAAANHSVVPF